jgi:hypothetical protein
MAQIGESVVPNKYTPMPTLSGGKNMGALARTKSLL